VGGIYGGIKLCRSNGHLPMRVSVTPLLERSPLVDGGFVEALHEDVLSEINQRLVLVYSGVQVL
jgi:hypothetical protein